jgi:hypothetical protein
VPLIARSAAQSTLIPLGVIAMLAVFGLILWKALSQPEVAPHPRGSLLPG